MADRLEVARTPAEVLRSSENARKTGKIALVPTMGALHDGHLSLVREAKRRAPFVVASVFVNPTQFGPNEDFDKYPRDLEGDQAKLASAGCDLLFAPDASTMYPPGDETRVRVGALAEHLCGPFRPGHFEGVATVVSKLFGVVRPDVALFGRKDYQQLKVLERIAADVFLRVSIVGLPIVRETDGLAMSSRNAYLSADDRTRALALSAGLSAAWRKHASGERSSDVIAGVALAHVIQAADSIDYVSVVDADSLQPATGSVGGRALVAIACRIGKTRLIDNVVLGEDPDPRAGMDDAARAG